MTLPSELPVWVALDLQAPLEEQVLGGAVPAT